MSLRKFICSISRAPDSRNANRNEAVTGTAAEQNTQGGDTEQTAGPGVSSSMEGADPTMRREKRRPKIYERNQEMGRDERTLTSLECGRVCHRSGCHLPLHTPAKCKE